MHNISVNYRPPRNPTYHHYDMRPFRHSSEQKHHQSHSVCIDEADSPSTSYRIELKHKRSLSRPIIPRLNLDYDYLE